MLEFLGHCFGFLCGQDPEHTWAPGGLLLPCCQRCLGLYVGAGVAAWLHWRLRPELSSRFLETHGIFLLLMAPCGLHWLPQNPLLRTISGVLFGFGMASFLWVPLRAWPGYFASYLAASDGGPVAQASKPAVSPTSKSAGCPPAPAPGGFGNPRYSRPGSLRYRRRMKMGGSTLPERRRTTWRVPAAGH